MNKKKHTDFRQKDTLARGWSGISVTRLGDLWDFGQVFKAFGNNQFTFLGNFLKVSRSIIFLVKSFLGNFYRQLAIFSCHSVWDPYS